MDPDERRNSGCGGTAAATVGAAAAAVVEMELMITGMQSSSCTALSPLRLLQQRCVRLLVSLLRLWRVAVMGMVVMGEGVAVVVVVVRRLLASPISSTSSFAHLSFSRSCCHNVPQSGDGKKEQAVINRAKRCGQGLWRSANLSSVCSMPLRALQAACTSTVSAQGTQMQKQ